MDLRAYSDATGNAVDSVSDEASRLGRLAGESGAHGVVCSGHEVARIRSESQDRLATLVPGVRLAGDSANDQSRVVTPADAAREGATYVVLGRTVTASSEPVAAMRRVLEDLSSGAR
jgi:orotidine-5'-phosphate decarboxylase